MQTAILAHGGDPIIERKFEKLEATLRTQLNAHRLGNNPDRYERAVEALILNLSGSLGRECGDGHLRFVLEQIAATTEAN